MYAPITGFGGLYGTKSKYGDMDITGDGAIEFFTNRIKITSKWPSPSVLEYEAGLEQQRQEKESGDIDHANFAGKMYIFILERKGICPLIIIINILNQIRTTAV